MVCRIIYINIYYTILGNTHDSTSKFYNTFFFFKKKNLRRKILFYNLCSLIKFSIEINTGLLGL